MMRTLIVIPARYGSTRLPGKPLHKIKGRTMLQRVVNVAAQAAKSGEVERVVATDHALIVEYCTGIGENCVMTSPDLRSGTDRALAAMDILKMAADFIINLQGDAPFTDPSHLRDLIEAARTGADDVYTPVVRLNWDELDELRKHKKTTPFSGTTCAVGPDGYVYWFSKQIIPAIRDESRLRQETPMSPVFRHIGIYGYRPQALRKFSNCGRGHYEQLEGLEQLRLLENGMTVHAVEVKPARISMSGIDSKEDVELAEQLIGKHGDPFMEL